MPYKTSCLLSPLQSRHPCSRDIWTLQCLLCYIFVGLLEICLSTLVARASIIQSPQTHISFPNLCLINFRIPTCMGSCQQKYRTEQNSLLPVPETTSPKGIASQQRKADIMLRDLAILVFLLFLDFFSVAHVRKFFLLCNITKRGPATTPSSCLSHVEFRPWPI